MGNFIDESKRGWFRENGNPTIEELTLGCLQRIAAATELSCKDREKLEREYKYMRDDRDYYRRESEQRGRRIAALKGQITKLKRAATPAKGESKNG